MAKKLSSPRLVSEKELKLHPKVRRTILAVVFLTLAAIFILAGFQEAGPAGSFFFQAFKKVFGWGYYLLPAISFLIALSFIGEAAGSSFLLISIGGVLFLISGLGFIDLISPGSGGIMITASHNPKNYNGLKIVDKKVQMINGEKVIKIMKKYE